MSSSVLSEDLSVSSEQDSDLDGLEHGVAISDEVKSVSKQFSLNTFAITKEPTTATSTTTDQTEEPTQKTPGYTDSEAETEGKQSTKSLTPVEEDVDTALENAIAAAIAINPSPEIRSYTPLYSPPSNLNKESVELQSEYLTNEPAVKSLTAVLDLPSLEARSFSTTQEPIPIATREPYAKEIATAEGRASPELIGRQLTCHV